MCSFIMNWGYKTFLALVISVVVVVLGQTPTSPTKPTPNQQQHNSKTSTSSSSSSFRIPDKDKKEILKAFESSLLNLFGLSSRPNPSRIIVVPQYMVDLYRTHTSNPDALTRNFNVKGKGLSTANTVRSFYHQDSQHLHGCEEDSCARIWFNMSNIPDTEVLTAAELRVYLERDFTVGGDGSSDTSLRHRLEVHEIMRPSIKHREAITRLVDVRQINVRNASWEAFDVHPAVLKWRKTPHFNHGLEVRILPYNNRPSISLLKHVRLRRSVDTPDNVWHSQRPLLVTYTDDGRGKKAPSRTRRASERKKRKSRNSRRRMKGKHQQCRRHPLYVDFSDVGWNDWIVAPPGYQAYYCHGDCPFPLAHQLNTTNHAIVQTLVHSVNPKAVPKACCVPTELSPISMLYLDEYEEVVLKNYQDMVVEGCGCR